MLVQDNTTVRQGILAQGVQTADRTAAAPTWSASTLRAKQNPFGNNQNKRRPGPLSSEIRTSDSDDWSFVP